MSTGISQLLVEAIAHDNAGNYYEMIEVAERAVKFYPDVSEAHYVLGSGHMRTGAYALAANSFRKSISKNSDCFEALNALAICQFNLGEVRRAQKNFAMVIKKKPDYAKAYYYQAECWLLLGDVNSAFTEWTLLSAVDKNLATILQQNFFRFLMS